MNNGTPYEHNLLPAPPPESCDCLLENVWTLAEGDEVKDGDGDVFTIKKVTGRDLVILQISMVICRYLRENKALCVAMKRWYASRNRICSVCPRRILSFFANEPFKDSSPGCITNACATRALYYLGGFILSFFLS